jgi:hypothetical protein
VPLRVSRSALAGSAAAMLLACSSTGDILPPADTYRLSISYGLDTQVFAMVGSSVQLETKVRTQSGEPVSFATPIAFVSRGPDVATVDATGLATIAGMGTTYIVASATNLTNILPDSIRVTGVCTAELRVAFTPVGATLSVGEGFVPTISLTTCGGQIPVTDVFSWFAQDRTVVSVDASTGATVALKAGSTFVVARGSESGPVASIPVTVR